MQFNRCWRIYSCINNVNPNLKISLNTAEAVVDILPSMENLIQLKIHSEYKEQITLSESLNDSFYTLSANANQALVYSLLSECEKPLTTFINFNWNTITRIGSEGGIKSDKISVYPANNSTNIKLYTSNKIITEWENIFQFLRQILHVIRKSYKFVCIEVKRRVEGGIRSVDNRYWDLEGIFPGFTQNPNTRGFWVKNNI